MIDRIFRQRIDNGISGFIIRSQVIECIAPAVCGRQRAGPELLSVLIREDRRGIWPVCSRLRTIVPGLGHRNFSIFIRVENRLLPVSVASLRSGIRCHPVIRHRVFISLVQDLRAVGKVAGQVRPGCRPAACCRQRR